MERLVAEHGACTQLLDIVNRPSWPPSLRDIAGGCLSFFCESYVNMAGFPLVVLPAEVAAQMQVRQRGGKGCCPTDCKMAYLPSAVRPFGRVVLT